MSAPFRILVADKIARAGLAPLAGDGRFELVEQPGLQGAELGAALKGCQGVLVRSAARITREVLEHADDLRVIGRAGVGVDTIDVEAATEKGIAVLNAPSGNTVSAAELSLALLLALVRRIPAADRSMKSGGWERSKLSGTELYGKTLGLIGVGRVGGEVARRARSFGMQIVAYDPYLSEKAAQALEVKLQPLDDVLRAADVVTLHVPLTDSTRGMLGTERLALLKPGAVLVNAARGGVVDEAALVAALKEGRLAGAALDVFSQEPLPKDHPLRSLDQVVLTPHLGASTEEAQLNVAVEIAEAVRAALLDGDLSRAVNAPAVGGEKMRRLRPLMELAERLGRLAAALADGPIRSVEVRYVGEEAEGLQPVAAGALIGILSSVVGRAGVNLVNAMHLAQAREIQVRQTLLHPARDAGEYLELRLQAGEGEVRAGGAFLAPGHPRIVRIGEHRVDIVPRGTLVVLRNRDVPGVIGRVGTILGNAGINIGEYHQARLSAGGDALAAISVDGSLGAELVRELKAVPEVRDVRQVQLD